MAEWRSALFCNQMQLRNQKRRPRALLPFHGCCDGTRLRRSEGRKHHRSLVLRTQEHHRRSEKKIPNGMAAICCSTPAILHLESLTSAEVHVNSSWGCVQSLICFVGAVSSFVPMFLFADLSTRTWCTVFLTNWRPSLHLSLIPTGIYTDDAYVCSFFPHSASSGYSDLCCFALHLHIFLSVSLTLYHTEMPVHYSRLMYVRRKRDRLLSIDASREPFSLYALSCGMFSMAYFFGNEELGATWECLSLAFSALSLGSLERYSAREGLRFWKSPGVCILIAVRLPVQSASSMFG